jgi:hypothetical protein
MLKKEEIHSKIDISRDPGDPLYSKEFARKSKNDEPLSLNSQQIYRESIREELHEDSNEQDYVAGRQHAG